MKILPYFITSLFLLTISDAIGQNMEKKIVIRELKENMNVEETPYFLIKILGLSNDFSFNINKIPFEDKYGKVHYKYDQYYNGIKIEYATIITHTEESVVTSLNGKYIDSLNINVSPSLSGLEAINLAFDGVDFEFKQLENENDSLVICKDDFSKGNVYKLTYKYEITISYPFDKFIAYIDAHTGELIHKNSIIKFHWSDSNILRKTKKSNSSHKSVIPANALTRYSYGKVIETKSVPGGYILDDISRGIKTKKMNEPSRIDFDFVSDFLDNDNNWGTEWNNSNKDNAALDAHWGAEQTFDYFLNIHNRYSYDDNGGQIKNYIHFDIANLNGGGSGLNAFYAGNGRIAYGDGSALNNYEPMTSLDLVAHEIGHAVGDYTADLIYQKESGALNESFSDIWAVCVEHYAAPEKDIWLLGEDIGYVFRSLSSPKDYNQPDTYEGQYWIPQSNCFPVSSNDYCGVHINSGVQNYWFYLLSTGGTGTNDNQLNYSVTGIGIDKAATIVYSMLTSYLTQNSDYEDSREASLMAAQTIFPNDIQILESIQNAWCAVGIGDCAPCSIDVNITQNVDANQSDIKHAQNTINAFNIIYNNGIAAYDAGVTVTLKDGFHAQSGSEFNVFIEGCGLQSERPYNYIYNQQILSLQENEKTITEEFVFKIYPNPVKNKMQLDSNEQIKSWLLTNLYGTLKLVSQESIDSHTTTINIDELQVGIYFLYTTFMNDTTIIRTIVKE